MTSCLAGTGLVGWLASAEATAAHPCVPPVAAYDHSVATDDASSVAPKVDGVYGAANNEQQMIL